jgi:hypothetical protein
MYVYQLELYGTYNYGTIDLADNFEKLKAKALEYAQDETNYGDYADEPVTSLEWSRERTDDKYNKSVYGYPLNAVLFSKWLHYQFVISKWEIAVPNLLPKDQKFYKKD